jgi:hypothetical protein
LRKNRPVVAERAMSFKTQICSLVEGSVPILAINQFIDQEKASLFYKPEIVSTIGTSAPAAAANSLFLIGGAIALLLLGGGLLYWYFKPKRKAASTSTTPSQQGASVKEKESTTESLNAAATVEKKVSNVSASNPNVVNRNASNRNVSVPEVSSSREVASSLAVPRGESAAVNANVSIGNASGRRNDSRAIGSQQGGDSSVVGSAVIDRSIPVPVETKSEVGVAVHESIPVPPQTPVSNNTPLDSSLSSSSNDYVYITPEKAQEILQIQREMNNAPSLGSVATVAETKAGENYVLPAIVKKPSINVNELIKSSADDAKAISKSLTEHFKSSSGASSSSRFSSRSSGASSVSSVSSRAPRAEFPNSIFFNKNLSPELKHRLGTERQELLKNQVVAVKFGDIIQQFPIVKWFGSDDMRTCFDTLGANMAVLIEKCIRNQVPAGPDVSYQIDIDADWVAMLKTLFPAMNTINMAEIFAFCDISTRGNGVLLPETRHLLAQHLKDTWLVGAHVLGRDVETVNRLGRLLSKFYAYF